MYRTRKSCVGYICRRDVYKSRWFYLRRYPIRHDSRPPKQYVHTSDENDCDSLLLNLARLPKATYNPDTKRTLCSREPSSYMSLELTSRPLSLTFGTFENSLLADPSAFEEPLVTSFITVVVDEKGEMINVIQEGLAAVGDHSGDVNMDESASSRTIQKCIEGARVRRLELLKVLKIWNCFISIVGGQPEAEHIGYTLAMYDWGFTLTILSHKW